MTAADIALTTTTAGPFDAAVARVREALSEQGFGVLTEINVKATLNKKLGDGVGDEVGDYLILGACNPKLAFRALEQNETAGLLLPCKAVVYQDEEGWFKVTLGRPKAVFGLLNDPATDPLADEVEQKLRAVFDSL